MLSFRLLAVRLTFGLLVMTPALFFAQPVVINEIMASNATTLIDEDGDYEDWIELYNEGDVPINLEDHFITDDPNEPEKWQFPSVIIGPQEYLIIFASGKNKTEGEILHTNFKISIEGEPILLSNPVGDMFDYLPNVVLYPDHSFGRVPDGETEMLLFSTSTPGTSNLTGVPHIPLTDTISFSAEQGFYVSAFDLQLNNLNPDASIYYTLNGSDPDTSSILYSGAIEISDNAQKPNVFSMIPTNAQGTYGSAGWKPPADTIFKGTVIKAQSFENGQAISPVYCHTYFVHPTIYSRYNNLPVISIVTDSLHLFDYETGIYVPGIHHDTIPEPTDVWRFGNYMQRGKEWERPAHITLFESDGTLGISQNVGLRIHGGATRLFPLKALRIYARNQYGKNIIDYPVFPWTDQHEYKRLLLRPSGNDWRHSLYSDGLSSLLIEDLNLLKQEYRPAVVFVNGEFWGLHNIRERIDKYFLEYKAGANPEEIDMINNWSEVVEGTSVTYENLVEYISNNDLIFNPYYEQASTIVDIENIIDYYIARQYTAVKDWPGNNNKFWRPTDSNGSFQWIFYDNDKALTDPFFDAINHSLNFTDDPHWYHNETHVFLFNNLFKNHEFREDYKNRVFYHLENSFKPERVHHLLDSIVDMIDPIMPEHIARWQFPISYEYWLEQIEITRDFADQRPCLLLEHLFNQMEVDPMEVPPGICDSIPNQETEPNQNNPLKIWPNPSSGYLNVKLDYENGMIHSIQIVDISGRSVFQQPANQTYNGDVIQFNLTTLKQGSYIIIIQTDKEIFRGLFEMFSKIR